MKCPHRSCGKEFVPTVVPATICPYCFRKFTPRAVAYASKIAGPSSRRTPNPLLLRKAKQRTD